MTKPIRVVTGLVKTGKPWWHCKVFLRFYCYPHHDGKGTHSYVTFLGVALPFGRGLLFQVENPFNS